MTLQNLRNLVGPGKLKEETPNEREFDGLIRSAAARLRDAHNAALAPESRFDLAYNAAHSLALAALPLVMHVPAWFAATHTADPQALGFTTDITPTLYAMLGRAPTPPAPMFGQPLFRANDEPAPARAADGQLVASSYGSVYGWISDNGRRLYVADGVDFRDYLFTLDGSPTGRAQSVGADDRRDGQQAIRAAVDAIARFYGFAGGS